MEIVKKSILRKVYPKKDPWSHKGDYGKLLIVAGSFMMTGSPTIIGMSALRAGVDVVYFAGPARAMNIVANMHPAFVNLPLKCDVLDQQCIEEVFQFASDMKITALVIGPGLWRDEETKKSILEIIDGFEVPIVVDADAVRALGKVSNYKEILEGKNVILTPHANEFQELTGEKITTNLKERISAVKDYAAKWKATIILKGHVDVISNGEKVAINKTGNMFMTKGGLGDSLTGICGAFLSRKQNKVDSYTAACAASYINGRAGDLAAKKSGIGLLVTEVIDSIPKVIRRG